MSFGKKKEISGSKNPVESMLVQRIDDIENIVARLANTVTKLAYQKTAIAENNGICINTSNDVLFDNKSVIHVKEQKFSVNSDNAIPLLNILRGIGIVCTVELPGIDNDISTVNVVKKPVVVPDPANIVVSPNT